MFLALGSYKGLGCEDVGSLGPHYGFSFEFQKFSKGGASRNARTPTVEDFVKSQTIRGKCSGFWLSLSTCSVARTFPQGVKAFWADMAEAFEVQQGT